MAASKTPASSRSWSPSSWRTKPNYYNVVYRDQKAAEAVLEELVKLPPLVTKAEIHELKKALTEVALGNAFVWQGGDCAELFDYCREVAIENRIKLLLQIGLIFAQTTEIRTILIGRMAGQYGKPRNGLTEVINGIQLPKFYGDNINSYDPGNREPDPERMRLAYFYSSSILNHMRSTLTSENETYNNALDWRLGSFAEERTEASHQKATANIAKVLAQTHSQAVLSPFIYTSHEGLFLHQEQAFTKGWRLLPASQDPLNPLNSALHHGEPEAGCTEWYNTSAHFIWIGDKTRQLNGAHVEYFRGLQNPIGIKLGPSIEADELVQLLHVVDPDKEPGKVSLITRLGESCVEQTLGCLIQAVHDSGHTVVWQCDPMHGNTRLTSAGIRTRSFSSIIRELTATMDIHRQHNSRLGGVHVEITPDSVVECVGGSEGWADDDLGPHYTTKCDPRLNKRQSLELAFSVANHYRALSGGLPYPKPKL
jgi:3-deoxy-7-phosphoheptulonate synthase